jgi:hypothetical protein
MDRSIERCRIEVASNSFMVPFNPRSNRSLIRFGSISTTTAGNHGTKLSQLVSITAVTGKAWGFETKHGADFGRTYLNKPDAGIRDDRPSLNRAPEVLVDYDNALESQLTPGSPTHTGAVGFPRDELPEWAWIG